MVTKVEIGLSRLILVNFAVAGLEIAASVAFALIPAMLLKVGFGERLISWLFGVGNNKATY